MTSREPVTSLFGVMSCHSGVQLLQLERASEGFHEGSDCGAGRTVSRFASTLTSTHLAWQGVALVTNSIGSISGAECKSFHDSMWPNH